MATTFLNAVTAIGPSLAIQASKGIKDHTIAATITGSPTAVTVDLEGSIDNTTFFQLGTHPFTGGELTASQAMFHVVEKPVKFIRLNLTVLTGGTAPTVTGRWEGFEYRN